MAAKEWASKNEIDLLRRTADTHRHAGHVKNPPPKPMGLRAAHSLIKKLVHLAIENGAPGAAN
jgi:hypothetical protein